ESPLFGQSRTLLLCCLPYDDLLPHSKGVVETVGQAAIPSWSPAATRRSRALLIGRFRPKLLKEPRRVAWLAKRLQSAEISLRRLSTFASDASSAQMCIAPVRSAMLKENVGISPSFNTRHNQRLGP